MFVRVHVCALYSGGTGTSKSCTAGKRRGGKRGHMSSRERWQKVGVDELIPSWLGDCLCTDSPSSPGPSSEEDLIIQFLLDLARGMLLYGAPSHEVEVCRGLQPSFLEHFLSLWTCTLLCGCWVFLVSMYRVKKSGCMCKAAQGGGDVDT